MRIKRYSELIKLQTFEERFEYLKLDGIIGEQTFGSHRSINQTFYHSRDWLSFRDKVIIRDNGCDLGVYGYDINGPILIHHINPITEEDILEQRKCVFDFENVICTRLSTHNAIHYGDKNLLLINVNERKPNDTCPWRK